MNSDHRFVDSEPMSLIPGEGAAERQDGVPGVGSKVTSMVLVDLSDSQALQDTTSASTFLSNSPVGSVMTVLLELLRRDADDTDRPTLIVFHRAQRYLTSPAECSCGLNDPLYQGIGFFAQSVNEQPAGKCSVLCSADDLAPFGTDLLRAATFLVSQEGVRVT